MLAEVAKDAAYRNNVRKVEMSILRGQIIGYLIVGVIVLVLLIVGWLMK